MAPYAGRQAAHAVIGGEGAFAPLAVRVVILAGWIGKEVFLDVGGCGLSGWVAMDSAADLACAVLGFTAVFFALRKSHLVR